MIIIVNTFLKLFPLYDVKGVLYYLYCPEYKTTLIIGRHPFFQLYLSEKGFLTTKSCFYLFFF